MYYLCRGLRETKEFFLFNLIYESCKFLTDRACRELPQWEVLILLTLAAKLRKLFKMDDPHSMYNASSFEDHVHVINCHFSHMLRGDKTIVDA